MNAYRTLPRPPRLTGPLVDALAATGRTRAQQARALGLTRAQFQDRLSGRRGARGWTDRQVQRLAVLLDVPVLDARALVDNHRDITITVDNAVTIDAFEDCAIDHGASVAVYRTCENGATIGVYSECGDCTAT